MYTRGPSLSTAKPVYSQGKAVAERMFFEAMSTIDVHRAMISKLEVQGDVLRAGQTNLTLSRPPRVVAFGKAATRMSAALVQLLDGRVAAGVVVGPDQPENKIANFRYFRGGHPYPSAGSLHGADAAVELVSGLDENDTVIFLVSGGGSALFERPLDASISLADLVELNRALVGCGLPIEQINVLRKHLSAVKGGRLARHAQPARQLTIFISDVPAQFPSMIASGPTMPDESTVEQTYSLVAANDLLSRFPVSVRKQFEQRRLQETPKPGDPAFLRSGYFCLLSNRDAVTAAKAAAETYGFACEIGSGDWDAEYREVARTSMTELAALAARYPGQPVCLVLGGEVICPVTGPGTGGRNQAFVLYAAEQIAGESKVVLSAGTDGRDGNSPASGAVADGRTISRARALRLDPDGYLAHSDSYFFFRALGDTVDTGFTDNNVRDLRLCLDFNSPRFR
jgi:glycerate 2-kinase